ncbi:CBO0543 family protein [Neobacillus drentensis]|uniref:CBO0543 family protein n=1 Tax=Neobacillus drentensis TaxID=220684 RepID=UPI002FFF4457
MNIVKHLNGLNSQPSPKKRSRFWNNPTLTTIFLSSILATYLDLFFVGKQMYHFPIRPLPEVFSINITFPLAGVPVLAFVFLQVMSRVNKWGKVGLIVFISLLMTIFEKFSELIGWFEHASTWNHLYTFFGYLLFLTIIYSFYRGLEKRKG